MFCEITNAHYTEYSKYDKRTDKIYSGFGTYKVINDILDIYGGRLKKKIELYHWKLYHENIIHL